MDRLPYDIQAAVATTHTSCFRQILNLLFDFYYVLEIITFGNYNGLDAGPLTLLSPYILSLVNANGPTYVDMMTTYKLHVTGHATLAAIPGTTILLPYVVLWPLH